MWKTQDVLRTSISLILSINHSQIVAWIAFYSKIVWEIQTKTFKVKKVVLIIDNCPPNPIIDNLSHAKLVFLSLCTTSVSFESTTLIWKNFCFTEFSTNIYWNTELAVSEVFHMITQSFKFFLFHHRTLSEKRDSSNRQ